MLKNGGLYFRINVIFKGGDNYMCDWQKSLPKMYKFIWAMKEFRDDLRQWCIERSDGVVLAHQDDEGDLDLFSADAKGRIVRKFLGI